MKVVIGADHRGFSLKEQLKEYHSWQLDMPVEWIDVGAGRLEPVDDYPDFAILLAEELQRNEEVSRGILICGSGIGMAVAINKFDGLRGGVGFNPQQVAAARQDDNINVLVLAADYVDPAGAVKLVEAFLQAEYQPTRDHQRRLDKIKQIEKGKT